MPSIDATSLDGVASMLSPLLVAHMDFWLQLLAFQARAGVFKLVAAMA
jgi:hypothetical protein